MQPSIEKRLERLEGEVVGLSKSIAKVRSLLETSLAEGKGKAAVTSALLHFALTIVAAVVIYFLTVGAHWPRLSP